MQVHYYLEQKILQLHFKVPYSRFIHLFNCCYFSEKRTTLGYNRGLAFHVSLRQKLWYVCAPVKAGRNQRVRVPVLRSAPLVSSIITRITRILQPYYIITSIFIYNLL